jgi:hypothetical protein
LHFAFCISVVSRKKDQGKMQNRRHWRKTAVVNQTFARYSADEPMQIAKCKLQIAFGDLTPEP